jgi:ubiquinone/menaquinone biosynthesis C-methylase UbiE
MTTQNQASVSPTHASSAGHNFAEADWLDTHFIAMQPEYEEMLRWVGIQLSWHVLDAACGSGSFLPLMTELVGPTGQVSAIDLAPENVAMVEKRAQQSGWPAPVAARVGKRLALPYADQSFDAVWCANTTQYLTDDELTTMLREFRRVVRPGGLVAIKEYDITTQLLQPLPPRLLPNFQDAMMRIGSTYFQQLFRAIDLQQWLRRAGLIDLRQKPTLMTRFQPIQPVLKSFLSGLIQYHYAQLPHLDLPVEEHHLWTTLADLEAPDHIFNHPDFQYRAIQTVFVGRVP